MIPNALRFHLDLGAAESDFNVVRPLAINQPDFCRFRAHGSTIWASKIIDFETSEAVLAILGFRPTHFWRRA